MTLLDVRLFVGYGLTAPEEKALLRSNPHLVALMTQGGDYLQEMRLDSGRFLGKFAATTPSIAALENLEANVLSLVRRLLPDSPHAQPILLALPHE